MGGKAAKRDEISLRLGNMELAFQYDEVPLASMLDMNVNNTSVCSCHHVAISHYNVDGVLKERKKNERFLIFKNAPRAATVSVSFLCACRVFVNIDVRIGEKCNVAVEWRKCVCVVGGRD
jgi:hypothetical protein